VDLHPLGEQVDRDLIVGLLGRRERVARGADHRLVPLDELAHHHLGRRRAGLFLDARQLRELREAAGRGDAEGAHAFGDAVHGCRQLGVLLLEHLVERAEHRSGDVPVEALRFQVKRVGVGEQVRESVRDGLAIGRADADLDVRCRRTAAFHLSCSHIAGSARIVPATPRCTAALTAEVVSAYRRA
jgi:hypothetical protein